MTSDSLETTIVDDSCLDDIFTMQSQSLGDFDFGLETNNVFVADTLFEWFQEHEKNSDRNFNYVTINSKTNNYSNNSIKANSGVSDSKQSDNIAIISSPRVRKSKTNRSSYMSTKSKGISLLAKPNKNCRKRSLLKNNSRHFELLSSYLHHEHDYCSNN